MAAKNKALLAKELRKLAQNNKHNAKINHPIYFVVDGATSIGPITAAQFRQLRKNHYIDDLLVRKDGEADAAPIVQYFDFIGLPSTPLQEDRKEFFYIREGVQVGPVGIKAIVQMIAEKELSFIDEISADAGATWDAVCNFSEFDRRRVKRALPQNAPAKSLLDKSTLEVKDGLAKVSNDKLDAAIVSDLVFLEEVKSKSRNSPPELSIEEVDDSTNWGVKFIGLGGVVLLAVLFINFAVSHKDEDDSKGHNMFSDYKLQKSSGKTTSSSAKKTLRSNKVRKKNTKSKFTSKHIKKSTKASKRSKKSHGTSFMKTDSFVKRTKPSKYKYSYDEDQREPFEQDPVRSLASRESLNPLDYGERDEDENEGEDDLNSLNLPYGKESWPPSDMEEHYDDY